MGPFEYKVTVYDEGKHCNENYKGITFADSYADAMYNIETYYGQDIIDVKIYGLEESLVYEINGDNFIDF